ncbi:1-phosphofructokinase family hexose kinase [uncultured Frigoribacterium sp.]|uniref:1-phosphofructokinase family hexose kinase n=1 Tax=uncultured Frigoribacterium sp. TaxID=335377 RepID=UPI0028D3A257|nr:1-phosphofructokinase family hexose kinase [uncultured Frigoribacterium sp.]
MTLNPSLDRTVEVSRLDRGDVVRTGAPLLEPAGKGVNVARALTAHGVRSVAVLPVGGREGAELSALLDAAGVSARYVPVSGRTRSNLTVAEPGGTVTKLNEPGLALSHDDLTAITAVVRATAEDATWIVVSGSLPPEISTATFARFVDDVRRTGAKLAVDTSGDALSAAVEARPDLLKPNLAELAELAGRSLDTLGDVVAAAEAVRVSGVGTVLVSLGAEGAVLVGPDGVVVGTSHVAVPRSTVGAGDSFLAGYLASETAGGAPRDRLLAALTWGAAATRLPGTTVPAPSDLDASEASLLAQPDLTSPLVGDAAAASSIPTRRTTSLPTTLTETHH